MVAFPKPAVLMAVCVCLAAAGGCGFQPMYASPGFAALPGARVQADDTRQGYLLEQALARFLGDGRSEYAIRLTVRTDERRLGVSAAGRASRFAYQMNVGYLLTGGSGPALRGNVSDTVYFDAPGDPYALIAARADAEERAADQLAVRLARAIATDLQRRAADEP